MKKFLSLILFQLKDKIDTSWVKQKKTLIQKIVFGVLKFVGVTGVVFGLLYLLTSIMIITKSDMMNLYIVFFSVMMVLSLISTTAGLMKSLYFADDNKVLVTLPVNSSQLFFSKLIVYYIFELKRAMDILFPVSLGAFIAMFVLKQISFISIIWSIIPMIFIIAFLILLGSLLSIPALYLFKFFKKYQLIELILFILLAVFIIFAVVRLIKLIPEDIDVQQQWPKFQKDLREIMNQFNIYVYPLTHSVRSMMGELNNVDLTYSLTGLSFLKFAIIFGADAILGGIVFLVIKPFYFVMMTKTSEFDKNSVGTGKKNILHQKYLTFVNKEFKLSFRDIEISGSYISIYIAVPILLLFIDSVFSAISTRLEGDQMAYAFNILLIVLPYLASNSVIATLYSKEGRAAYIKKTKPINPLFPLISKLVFNLIFSIPSIVACSFVFADFAKLSPWLVALLSLSILLIQYAHILYSATLDIMNPQNEGYATNGDDFVNPNEKTATAVGFICSFILALICFFFFKESYRLYSNYNLAIAKILVIAALAFGSSLLLFVLKIKAFYYER